MAAKRNWREERPVRHFIAVTVFRAIWWPAVGLAMPFALIGSLVDWLSWTAFPAVANFVQPAWGAVHTAAFALGNKILGYEPEPEA